MAQKGMEVQEEEAQEVLFVNQPVKRETLYTKIKGITLAICTPILYL